MGREEREGEKGSKREREKERRKEGWTGRGWRSGRDGERQRS